MNLSTPPKTIYLDDYTPPSYTITHVDLTFVLDPHDTHVTSILYVRRNGVHQHPLVLNGEHLTLERVMLDDEVLEPSAYVQSDTSLTLYPTHEECVIEIANRINPSANKALDGLYMSEGIFCTQNEPEGFRRITYYLDRPDVMAIFSTRIIAPKESFPVLLSNGNLIEEGDLEQGYHYALWEDPFPKPSYLYALVAGNLGRVHDSFTTMRGRTIDLDIYCDIGNESKCDFAMASLKKAMAWDEERFGREYDLERYMIVAVDAFNMGAMENKGLNIFNSHYVLANPQSATDSDFMGIESVIGHEYFHNWTGNRITCRDWFQLTLKEGLTVYRDQEFSADLNDADVQRIGEVAQLRQRQFPEDASATAHPIKPRSYIQINNFYTATIYEKGAEVIRMLEHILGREGFKNGMDLYFATFDGQAVRTEDFLWAMGEANGYDTTQFARWYSQVGTPIVRVETHYDATQSHFSLTLFQESPESLVIPLSMALIGEGQTSHASMLIFDQKVQTFSFDGIAQEPYLSINRGFSAPIILDMHPRKGALGYLMKHDSDAFNRYEAAQEYALVVMDRLYDAALSGMQMSVEPAYIEAFGAILSDALMSNAIKAKMVEIPTIDRMMQRHVDIDIGALYGAREFLRTTLAGAFEEELYAIASSIHASTYTLDNASIGSRALKNSLMQLLGALGNARIVQKAYTNYENATNMTDRFAMLSLLSHIDCPERVASQEHFYATYAHDTLVMNKYLAVIAQSTLPETPARVKAMQNDAVYDPMVPNLVRALIGSFAKNHRYFHSIDGSGYAFIADKIIALDLFNPQIASSLALAFRIMGRLNQTQQTLMRKELERILEVENLSSNLYEIVAKLLNKA
ncbi:MAG: hypothetical protein KU37_02520 [Sulfuricurvum sp. PC08-66]|nr:MAG: hypothetical protein KU37_02520 [Sulfuricurvum sp. PC08-66]